MSPLNLSAGEQTLYDLVTGPAPTTIAEVVVRMEAIDGLLMPDDGLKWFNRLYLVVTRQVDLQPPGGAWQSPIWLERLDVLFAGLYFTAVASSLAGQTVASSWEALFEARSKTGIDRVQFAVAGMNAHINHDLALALLATNSELGITPASGSPEYNDYQAVNELLNSLIPEVLTLLATDTLGVLAQDTGKIGRVLAYWKIRQARNLAWDFANHLRGLNVFLREAALDAQDGLTGALGRAILVMP